MALKLKDISEKAGVSTATVSRVLTGQGYVKEETRLKVEEAVNSMNYVHTGRRKSSSQALSNTILIITGNLDNPVFVSYITGISSTLENAGKKVFIYFSDDQPEKEEMYLKLADELGFQGVIMLNAVETSSIAQILRAQKCPVVMVNRSLHSVNTDLVAINNLRGGFLGTDYLIRHGHRHIAHLAGAPNSNTSQERLLGFMDAMQMANCPVAENAIYYGNLKYSGGYAFGQTLCAMPPEERFTAVYSANGEMTNGLVDALYNGGLSVPDDISIVCMDNMTSLENGRIKITAVDYPPEKMGIAAAEMLLERIHFPDGERRQIIYSPEIIERNSVSSL